jgi:hypothetical protein
MILIKIEGIASSCEFLGVADVSCKKFQDNIHTTEFGTGCQFRMWDETFLSHEEPDGGIGNTLIKV